MAYTKVEKDTIKEVVQDADAWTFHNDGSITAKRSYFYYDRKAEKRMRLQIEDIPNSKIISSDDHMRPFCGGAKTGSAKDSYFWIKFMIDGKLPHGQFGLRWQEWGRDGRLQMKEKIFSTREGRMRFLNRLEKQDKFYGQYSTYDEEAW